MAALRGSRGQAPCILASTCRYLWVRCGPSARGRGYPARRDFATGVSFAGIITGPLNALEFLLARGYLEGAV